MLPYSVAESVTLDIIFDQSQKKLNGMDEIAFSSYMQIIDQYIIDNKLTVNRESKYSYKLYAKFPVFVSRAISQLIYESDPQGLAMYSAVITKIANKELSVSVCGRELLTVYMNVIHRGAAVVDVMIEHYEDSFFLPQKQLKVFGPDLRLMSIYKILSDPSKCSDWQGCIDKELVDRKIFLSMISDKYGGNSSPDVLADGSPDVLADGSADDSAEYPNDATGGKQDRRDRHGKQDRHDRHDRHDKQDRHGKQDRHDRHDKQDRHDRHDKRDAGPDAQKRREIIHDASNAIIQFVSSKPAFLNSHLFVGRSVSQDLIDDYSSHKDTSKRSNPNYRLQIITTNHTEKEIELLSLALKQFRPDKIKVIEFSTNIPVYTKLKYRTLYLYDNIPLLDIFDCGEYDIFPSMYHDLNGHTVRIGTPQVLLLFNLVNVWLIKMQSMFDRGSEGFKESAGSILESAYGQYKGLTDLFDSLDPEILFPIEENMYVGKYIDPIIMNRRDTFKKKQESTFYPPYYPKATNTQND